MRAHSPEPLSFQDSWPGPSGEASSLTPAAPGPGTEQAGRSRRPPAPFRGPVLRRGQDLRDIRVDGLQTRPRMPAVRSVPESVCQPLWGGDPRLQGPGQGRGRVHGN